MREHDFLDKLLPDRQAITARREAKGKRQRSDDLASKFRLAIRETMTKDEIQALIEDRLLKELRGTVEVKIAPTILKIAAQEPLYDKPKRSPVTPLVHVHLQTLSDAQLQAYQERGEIPENSRSILGAEPSGEQADS